MNFDDGSDGSSNTDSSEIKTLDDGCKRYGKGAVIGIACHGNNLDLQALRSKYSHCKELSGASSVGITFECTSENNPGIPSGCTVKGSEVSYLVVHCEGTLQPSSMPSGCVDTGKNAGLFPPYDDIWHCPK